VPPTNWKVVVVGGGAELLAEQVLRLEEAGCSVTHCQAEDEETIAAACNGADALLVGLPRITQHILSACPGCKVVVRFGVGYDNIDVEAARQVGIPVCHVPDYCTTEVADHTMATMLCLLRGVNAQHNVITSGQWPRADLTNVRRLSELTLGIVGCGRIGQAVIERARGFRFRILGCDPKLTDEDFEAIGVEPASLDELLSQADVVSLHVALSEKTHHLINAGSLSKMKPDAILVNTARGKVVETVALASALSEGRLAGAAIDVFEDEPLPSDHPLRSSPNTLLTAHSAWYSESSVRQLHELATDEAIRVRRGEPLRCPIS
jgi:D-3-phosphoglycerate dehydrogenase